MSPFSEVRKRIVLRSRVLNQDLNPTYVPVPVRVGGGENKVVCEKYGCI